MARILEELKKLVIKRVLLPSRRRERKEITIPMAHGKE